MFIYYINVSILFKMKEEYNTGIDELDKEDKFKKIKFSPDSTDLMSDFSDK